MVKKQFNFTSFICMIIKPFWGWSHSKIYFGGEYGLRQTTISYSSFNISSRWAH